MSNAQALVENLLNALSAGVLIGCLYGLMCLGLGMIFGIMRVVNFAQGEFLMLGMYTAFYLFGGWGLLTVLGPVVGPFAGALLAGPVVFIIGLVLHRLLIARVSGLRTIGSLDEGHFGQLMVTLGLSLILQNGGLILFGSTPRAIRTPLASSAWMVETGIFDAAVFLNKTRVISGVIAIAATAILWYVLERTRLGRRLRAAADNPVAATYTGVDVDRAHRIAFATGSGVTAIAGGLLAVNLSFTPFTGVEFVLIMYSGVVLGGMGSILGAFWGGLVVGFVQQFSAIMLPIQLQNAAIFAIFLLIITFRPQGLFGRSAERMRPGAAPRVRRDLCLLAAAAVLYGGLSLLVSNSYYQLMLTLVPIWAVMGLSWNLFSGFVGLVSFGHAAFFGIGAYTVAMGLVLFGLTPWAGIPLGAALGGCAAFLIGLPTLRLRGHYFALAMLAYPILFLYILQYLGWQEVPLPMHRGNPVAYLQFNDPRAYTMVALGLLLVAAVIAVAVENSRFGLALMAIRQNELAAEAAGLDTWRWKMRGLVLSGAMAAAAGGLYVCVLLIVTPDAVFGILISAQALTVALFGGVATVWGPLIGAVVLIPLAETLNAQLSGVLPGIQGVVYGVAVIVIILVAPEGVFWKLRDRVLARRSVTPIMPPSPPPVAAIARSEPVRDAGAFLTVQGLSKSFGGLKAVSDVSFTAARGHVLGIIGPNGAGKTTLFNVLNGVLPASAGQARMESADLVGLQVHQVARLGVGRTFQVVRSFARLSLLDNVVVGAYGAGLRDAEAIAAAQDALARVGLGHLAEQAAGQLTNKSLRLMELARALAGRPRLLLLDETLAGLGREECDDLLAVLARLRDEGMTIVIIEHTMHAMLRIADSLLVIDHGQVLASGEPRTVIENPAVIEAYLGKKWLKRCAA